MIKHEMFNINVSCSIFTIPIGEFSYRAFRVMSRGFETDTGYTSSFIVAAYMNSEGTFEPIFLNTVMTLKSNRNTTDADVALYT